MGDIRQQLREQGREQLAAIARGDPDAPQVSAEEFRAGFERLQVRERMAGAHRQGASRRAVQDGIHL
jgi:hypothetical protein